MCTRVAGITSPLLSDFCEGSVGSTIEMYFWPNSVVGRMSMLMFSGMFLAAEGTSATSDTGTKSLNGSYASLLYRNGFMTRVPSIAISRV